MYHILNRYLFLNKSIPIPGLGTICMESLPASIDASTRSIMPPTYRFRFDKFFDSPDKDLFLTCQPNSKFQIMKHFVSTMILPIP